MADIKIEPVSSETVNGQQSSYIPSLSNIKEESNKNAMGIEMYQPDSSKYPLSGDNNQTQLCDTRSTSFKHIDGLDNNSDIEERIQPLQVYIHYM